jgi:hypothetical protein
MNIGEKNYQYSMDLVIHLFHTLHLSLIIISKLNINHEDVNMKMFILSLEFLKDEIMDWYGKLGEGNLNFIFVQDVS